ncbi:MAG: PAS domain S-box protein [Nitrospiria bacterium]
MPDQNKQNSEWGRDAEQRPESDPFLNLPKLNVEGKLVAILGQETLDKMMDDYLDLLDTSAAIIERNGDYAVGRASSNWCRLLNETSRADCETDDDKAAMQSGKWHCHESCWKTSKASMDREQAVDLPCLGGIRIYALPLYASGEIVGAINFGYGDPSKDPAEIEKVSKRYGLDTKELSLAAGKYRSVPPFVYEYAKRRLATAAQRIGEMIERQEVEKRLSVMSQQYEQLLETIPQGVVEIDLQGKILFANKADHKRLGYPDGALIGLNVRNLITEENRDRTVSAIAAAASGQPVPNPYSTKEVTKDGRIIDIEVFWSGKRNAKGEIIGFISIINDITERKRGEEILRESEARFRTIFEQSSDSILLVDIENGRIVAFNEKAHRNLGYTRGEFAGLKMDDLETHDSEQKIHGRIKNLKCNGSDTFLSRHRTKKGSVRDIQVTISQITLSGKKYFLVICRDITERKQLEDQLLQTQKLKSVGQLAGGIAHEFNNLLTPIIGHLESALAQSADRPKMKETLLPAEKAARRAAALTKELLAFSRQNPLDLQNQDLSAIAEEAVHLLRQTINRRIEMTIESQESLRPVLIDADQIHQVIMNLCINARDALLEGLDEGRDGQPAIRIKIANLHLDEAFSQRHPGASAGDYVCLSVSDNGPGIDEATQQHLFEPFFTTKEVGRGTGLGLASSYGIVKNHKGWIDMKSTKGQGATFEIYLPRSEQPLAQTPRPLADHAETGGSETILFVDDDELIRGMAQTALEMRGYKVLLAESGDRTLEIFREKHAEIQLVILDLTMPRQSGWEVLRRLRSLAPALKVILSSGHDISGQAKDPKDLEAVAMLPKPYTPRDLVKKVRDILDRDDPPS